MLALPVPSIRISIGAVIDVVVGWTWHNVWCVLPSAKLVCRERGPHKVERAGKGEKSRFTGSLDGGREEVREKFELIMQYMVVPYIYKSSDLLP